MKFIEFKSDTRHVLIRKKSIECIEVIEKDGKYEIILFMSSKDGSVSNLSEEETKQIIKQITEN